MRRLTLLIGALMAVAALTAAPALAASPTATTLPATSVTDTSATLNGTVNLAGQTLSPVMGCEFQYLPTASDSGGQFVGAATAPCAPTPSGSSAVAVSAKVTGLTAKTAYDYRVVLNTVSLPPTTDGATVTFTTSAGPVAPTGTTGAASNIAGTSATLNATVDPGGGTVSSCAFELGTTTSYGSTVPCSSTPSGSTSQAVSANATGLTPSTQYHFRIVVKTSSGTLVGNDSSFTTAVVGTATTLPPSPVTATTATVHGTVNPQGLSVTSCAFYIGTGRGFQSDVPCTPTPQGGSQTQAVSASFQGLLPSTPYHLALILQTPNGYAIGNVVYFTTRAEPTGSTGAATSVTASGARLHGTVNPHGAPVVACLFEYGIAPFSGSGSSSSDVGCSPKPSGSRDVAVSATLKGLAARTTYYYRVVMETQGGILVGATRTFVTRASALPPGVRITGAQISSRGHSARFEFRATGARATRYECTLTGGGGKVRSTRNCHSPIAYRGLKPGSYVFTVRAGDAARYGQARTRRFRLR